MMKSVTSNCDIHQITFFIELSSCVGRATTFAALNYISTGQFDPVTRNQLDYYRKTLGVQGERTDHGITRYASIPWWPRSLLYPLMNGLSILSPGITLYNKPTVDSMFYGDDVWKQRLLALILDPTTGRFDARRLLNMDETPEFIDLI